MPCNLMGTMQGTFTNLPVQVDVLDYGVRVAMSGVIIGKYIFYDKAKTE